MSVVLAGGRSFPSPVAEGTPQFQYFKKNLPGAVEDADLAFFKALGRNANQCSESSDRNWEQILLDASMAFLSPVVECYYRTVLQDFGEPVLLGERLEQCIHELIGRELGTRLGRYVRPEAQSMADRVGARVRLQASVRLAACRTELIEDYRITEAMIRAAGQDEQPEEELQEAPPSLAQQRAQLLESYKRATGITKNCEIYSEAPFLKRPTIWKADFYRWTTGKLPPDSRTAVRLEDALRKHERFVRDTDI